MTPIPAFVTRFVRAEKFLAIVDDRWDRFEGYQDLVWSLELLLRDVLRDVMGSREAEVWPLAKLVRVVRDEADLPKALQQGLEEVLSHRNIFVHALQWDGLDGRTYADDLECVRLVALWYLRDFRKGPCLGITDAARLLAGDGSGNQSSRDSTRASAHVFLSYASEDQVEASRLYKQLRVRGHSPWMDKHDLLPGQDWEAEIRRAIERADFFIALMSRCSVTKRGFVQKEIRFALEVLGEIPPGRIYFIPVRLEECDVPDVIRQLHWLDLQSEDAHRALWEAIETPPSS